MIQIVLASLIFGIKLTMCAKHITKTFEQDEICNGLLHRVFLNFPLNFYIKKIIYYIKIGKP